MNRERRSLHGGGLRAFEQDGDHFITARVVRYDVTDDFGSRWSPGVFDKSINERMPTLAWAHSWDEPLGRAIEFDPDPEGPVLTFRLDDFVDVPMARRAFSQVNSGTLDDVSVGFSDVIRRPPTPEEREQYPGIKEVILQASLDECSVVLRGAVQGAKVLALRSAGEMIPAETAAQIMARFGAGELDLLGALTLVKESAVSETDPKKPEESDESKDDEEKEPDLSEVISEEFNAEIEQALATASRLD